jgi:2-polyprenyl-6-methoxyphenol hydroxylase-like FAD-dependent oxidoreductase
MKVAIIGGGVSGAALARVLSAQSSLFHVSVFERDTSKDLPDRRGSVITLHPNGALALKEVGVDASRLDAASQDFVLFEKNGKRIGAFSANVGGKLVTRHGLKQMLLTGLDDVVQYDARVTEVIEQESSVILGFEKGEEKTFDLVIGADGASSKSSVRSKVVSSSGKSYRGVARINGKVDEAKLSDVGKEILENTSMTLGDGSVFFISRNPTEKTILWSLAFPHADDSTFPQFTSKEETIDFVMQRLEAAQWWSECLKLVQLSDSVGTVSGYYDHDPIPSYSKSRIILMGDCAHAMTPYQGQGANLALEDACVLGKLLTAEPKDLEWVKKSYDDLRMEKTKNLQDASRRGMQMFHW